MLQAQDSLVSFQRFYKDQLKAQQQKKAAKYSNRGRQQHSHSKHRAPGSGKERTADRGHEHSGARASSGSSDGAQLSAVKRQVRVPAEVPDWADSHTAWSHGTLHTAGCEPLEQQLRGIDQGCLASRSSQRLLWACCGVNRLRRWGLLSSAASPCSNDL